MNHLDPPTPWRPPGRALAFFVLAGLIGLVSSASGFADRLPADPVERFQKALQQEQTDYLDTPLEGEAMKLALEYREKSLKKAAADLKSLSDVAQALLLIWPEADAPGYQKKARAIDERIHNELLTRFDRGVRKTLKDGTPARQAAVLILLGETAYFSTTDFVRDPPPALKPGEKPKAPPLPAGREKLSQEVYKLAPEIIRKTKSTSPEVRGAAARALRRFPKRPYTVACALDGVLENDRNALNRRTAAESLVAMIQMVTGTEPQQASEPGVLSREARRSKPAFSAGEEINVWAAVIPVAARGLSDPDVRVRRASVSALHQATTSLSKDIFRATPKDQWLRGLPPRDRKLTPAEKKRILEERGDLVDRYERQIKPALAALTSDKPVCGTPVPRALAAAADDRDIEVRLGVRRTLDEMARAHRFLTALRTALPSFEEELDKPKDKEKGKDKKEKKEKKENGVGKKTSKVPITLVSGNASVLHLPPPPSPRRALRDEDKAEDVVRDEDPYRDAKVHPDALGRTLVALGRSILRRGATDPNPAGRRASVEAIEALGESGAVFIPNLIEALKDRDLFVRWIAARALGKLAPAEADDVVPALVCLLDEDDLDVRITVAEAIGLYGSSAAGAVPALAARLCKGDSESRLAMLAALENIGPRAAAALPAIKPLLTNTDPRLRAEAARVMGRFGKAARDYLPALQPLLRDPDSEVRRSASAAIIAITDE